RSALVAQRNSVGAAGPISFTPLSKGCYDVHLPAQLSAEIGDEGPTRPARGRTAGRQGGTVHLGVGAGSLRGRVWTGPLARTGSESAGRWGSRPPRRLPPL